MYINIVFIEYMVAVFSGLGGIIFMVATLKNHITSFSIKVTFFIVSSFCCSLIYFIFYYCENVLKIYEISAPWRALDFLIGCLFLFSWVLLVLALSDRSKISKVYCIIGAFALARCLYSNTVSLFFMNDYYTITDKNLSFTLYIFDAFFIILSMLLIIICSIYSIRYALLFKTKLFIVIVSTSLVLLEINLCIVDYNLYNGLLGLSGWDMQIFDPAGVVFSIINVTTIIFILKADFSPIYIVSKHSNNYINDKVDEDKMRLDQTAEKHSLTLREREILELVYKGYTNPDISKELYISINTVKSHINHIFEKLHVSSRIELIHLINSQKN